MGLLSYLKNKPEGERKVISLVLSAVLTLLIVGFWFSWGRSDGQEPVETGKLSSISPWQVIKDEFSKAFSGFDDQVSELNTELASATAALASSSDQTDGQASTTATTTDTVTDIATSSEQNKNNN